MMFNPGLGFLLLSLAFICHHVTSLPLYASLIPNGLTVPNPNPQGGVWAGVGHVNAAGGSLDLNPFGMDFAAAGHEWTTALCEMDSDQDGRSNGVELGDPDCTWLVGGGEPTNPSLSHPGIADEPVNTPIIGTCTNYSEPDVIEEMEFKFSAPNRVNETQTHYVCEQQVMDIPKSGLYHQVKSRALLDNDALLHHMFIYLCPAGLTSSDGNRVGKGSYDCQGQVEVNCIQLAGWAVGPIEKCLPPMIGQEVDFSGLDQVVFKVEAHYDNSLGTEQEDQSGISVTLTPNLRPIVMGQTFLGMAAVNNDFSIPAESVRYPLSGICPSEATALLPHPIYAFQFTPHMHLAGRGAYTEHWRCGVKLGEIGRVEDYEFDNQLTYGFSKPVKILPGDALVTKCIFDTVGQNRTVVGGDSTSDEMCLNMLGYYPKVQVDNSSSFFSICFSFLHGIRDITFASNLRVAVVDRSSQLTGSGRIFTFEDDPIKSWSSCCDTGDCEEMYRSSLGEYCGMDEDCVEGLICENGICGTDTTAAATGQTSSNAVVCQGFDGLMATIPIGIISIAFLLL